MAAASPCPALAHVVRRPRARPRAAARDVEWGGWARAKANCRAVREKPTRPCGACGLRRRRDPRARLLQSPAQPLRESCQHDQLIALGLLLQDLAVRMDLGQHAP